MVAKSLDEILAGGVKNFNADELGTAIRNLDSSISDETISSAFKNANFSDKDLATIFKSLEPEDATRLAKAFDQPSIDKILIAAGDDASDLAIRIGRQPTLNEVKWVGVGDSKIDNKVFVRNQRNLDSANLRGARGKDTSKAIDEVNNLPDEAGEDEVYKAVQKEVPGATNEEISQGVKDGAAILRNSGEAKQAMGALGFVKKSWGNFTTWTAKNWYKLGAVLFLLCLMYDTNNPFTALDRAVDDAGKFVRGLKDVADKTTQSAKNTFDVLAWVTGNPFVSVGSSAACVIMMLGIGVSTMKG